MLVRSDMYQLSGMYQLLDWCKLDPVFYQLLGMYQLSGMYYLSSWCKLDPACISCLADVS